MTDLKAKRKIKNKNLNNLAITYPTRRSKVLIRIIRQNKVKKEVREPPKKKVTVKVKGNKKII